MEIWEEGSPSPTTRLIPKYDFVAPLYKKGRGIEYSRWPFSKET